MRTPHYYHTGTFLPFKEDFLRSDGLIQHHSAGTILVSPNMFMDKCYYITKGVVRFFLTGDRGREKTISFTGVDSIFPLYSPVQHQYKLQFDVMMMEAYTDIEVICIRQKTLYNLLVSNSAMALAMLDQYADLADILLYEAVKLSTSATQTQICDFLLYYHDVLLPAGISMNQSQFASCVGTSLLNVARTFKFLRQSEIISTSRSRITVLQYEKLLELSSRELSEQL